MVTAHYREQAPRVWEFAFLYLLDPSAVDAYRYLMFCLTGRGTGVTPNALPIVNNKSVFHALFQNIFL